MDTIDTTVLKELRSNVTTPCVSIIIPTHKLSPERALDELKVSKMLKQAEALVLDKCGKNNGGEEVIIKLNELAENIDFVHNNMGIGFFVSPNVSRLVSFPFPVREKVFVGNSFEVRDIIYLAETMINYCLLLINEKDIKLFEGNGEILKPIKDENFPMHFLDDYEYSRPALGSSYGYSLKSTEKDKSIVKEQRFTTFLKHADEKLSNYIFPNTPLIISGSSKELGYFNKISNNINNIVGEIRGNYVYENIQTLGGFSFDKIKEYLKVEEENVLTRLENAIGKKLAVTGIQDVWKASTEGKGLILLVEKDYAVKAYITKDDSSLFLNPPKKNHEVIEDAVDDVMEIVMNKGGKVVVVEDGKLARFGSIAMILRYW